MDSHTVASDDGNTATNDHLPIPNVYYPGHYGTFFAFSTDKECFPYLCSCSKSAVENLLHFKEQRNQQENSDPLRMAPLDSSHFPKIIARESLEYKDSPMDFIEFQEGICHACNQILPKYRYCAGMYGTKFKQHYGWYINKKGFELGINLKKYNTFSKMQNILIFPFCKEEVIRSLEERIQADLEKYRKLKEKGKSKLTEEEKSELKELKERLLQDSKNIADRIENKVRETFGHYKKGERWTSETVLFHLVETLYPDYSLKRHHRPEYLEGLELDIFIEEEQVGIEYQGVQHFEAVEHWGGKEALKERQERDKRKRELCKEQGINLVYFTYEEELSEELVEDKLDPFL